MTDDWPGEVRAGAVTALLVTLLGAPIGLAWAAVRPRLDYADAALQESVFQVQLTTDVRLLLLGLAAGFAVGVTAWLLTRAHGVGVAVGLVVGGTLAMLAAAAVGPLAAHPDRLEAQVTRSFVARGYKPIADIGEPDRTNFLINVRFTNRARSVDLGLPLAACGVFALLTWRRDRSSADEGPPSAVSWGSAAPGSAPAPGRPSAW